MKKKNQQVAMVPISVVAPGDSDKIADTDAANMGMVKVKEIDMRALKSLGIEIDGAGSVSVDKGCAFITKRAAINCIQKLEAMIPTADPEGIHAIAGSLAKLAKAMGEIISKTLGSSHHVPKDGAGEAKPRRSFPVGGTAVFAHEAHFHTSGEPPKQNQQ